MGRQQRPEADANSGRGGSGEPSRQPRAGSRSPGAARLRRPGTGGPRRESGGAHAPGRPSSSLTSLAGGGHLLPAPGRTHNLLSFPDGTSTAEKTVLPSSLLPLKPQRARARLGRRSRARLRRLPKRTGCAATSGARAPRVSRAGARTQMHRPLFGRRGTHRLLLRCPALLFLLFPPLAPRGPGADRPGRGAVGGDQARGARRGAPLCALGSKPISWGGVRGSPSLEPPPALLSL